MIIMVRRGKLVQMNWEVYMEQRMIHLGLKKQVIIWRFNKLIF